MLTDHYSNQELSKSLFRDTAFGRDRFVFDVNSFFTGFFIGVKLATPALGGVLSTALKDVLKQGLQVRILILLLDLFLLIAAVGSQGRNQGQHKTRCRRRPYNQWGTFRRFPSSFVQATTELFVE